VARWSTLENDPRSGTPFLGSQSIDCGEWRNGAFSIWNIVVAHHRKVARHGQAPAAGLAAIACMTDIDRMAVASGVAFEHHARRIAVPGIGLNHRNVIDVKAGIGKSVGIAMKLLLIGGCAGRL
jgi:hypothetical protein